MFNVHRTQLILEDWQYEKLRSLSEQQGRSISELLREILTKHLGSEARRVSERLAEVCGIAEGPEDLAREHDRYLYGEGEEA